MGFQTQANTVLGVAVAGDFADHNPRFSVPAGPAGFVAGASGLTVGRFAWFGASSLDPNNEPTIVNNFVGPNDIYQGSNAVIGFVPRLQQGLITTYLADSTMLIPAGFGVSLMSGGAFWVKNDGSSAATIGQYAYADLSTGKVSFAAASSASTASGSTSSIAASTFSVTGSISGNVLTVAAVSSGTVVSGATISGTGITTGTMIISQLTGTAGGVGTYAVTPAEQTTASVTVSGTYGTLTVGGSVTGTFQVGGLLSGTNVVAGTYIAQFGTGTGGAGTYFVTNNTVVSSTAISGTTNVQTKFVAVSSGLAGELVKMTSNVLG